MLQQTEQVNIYMSLKRSILYILLPTLLMLIFFGLGKHSASAATARTDTSNYCRYYVSISSQGTLTNGNPYISLQYTIAGDDYARYFDIFGTYYYENGAQIDSNSCTPAGALTNLQWTGTQIDDGNAYYTALFNGLGGSSIKNVYLGTPTGLGAGYNAAPPGPPAFVGTGDNYCGSGVGVNDTVIGDPGNAGFGQLGRPFHGIISCFSNPGDDSVYGLINDAGLVTLNGQTLWCVEVNPGDPVCRGGEVARSYVAGGDYAGYISANNVNSLGNITGANGWQSMIASDTSAAPTPFATGPSLINLDLNGVNTRDNLFPGFSYGSCFTWTPGNGSCPLGASPSNTRDPYVADRVGQIITYELNATPPPQPVLSCSSVFNGLPSSATVGTSYPFTMDYDVATAAFTGGTITVTSSPVGSTVTPGSAATSGPVGTVTSPSFSFKATSAGVYTISYSVSGGNVSNTAGPCTTTVIVGTSPYLDVQGGNVSTGSGGFTNSCTPNNTPGILAYNQGGPSYTGSGTNLATLAPSIINGFVSSDGHNGYKAATPKGLSFANVGVPSIYGGSLGSQGRGDCSPDYYGAAAAETASVATPVAGNTFNLNSPPACRVVIGTSYCWIKPTVGNNYVNIVNSGAPYGGRMVLFVEGDVVIKGNILLNQNYASTAGIPKFYLITKGNINVSNSPINSEIDGVYVAQPSAANTLAGVMTTCTNNNLEYSAATLYTNCNNRLRIDGAVVARQLRLNRVFGDVKTINNAAETFSYNPNTWIVNSLAAGGTTASNPSYAGIKFLPPVL